VDAIELLTPTYLHAEQIVTALAAGKHVSCQKPIAVSVAEADRIVAAVARARTTFRVTENFLYYPPIVKAKELLDAGAIGEPSLVRIHTTRVRDIVGQAFDLDPDALVGGAIPAGTPAAPLRRRRPQVRHGHVLDRGLRRVETCQRGSDFPGGPSVATWRSRPESSASSTTHAPTCHRGATTRPTSSSATARGASWVTRCTGEMLGLPQ
jgi:hypothetical protein